MPWPSARPLPDTFLLRNIAWPAANKFQGYLYVSFLSLRGWWKRLRSPAGQNRDVPTQDLSVLHRHLRDESKDEAPRLFLQVHRRRFLRESKFHCGLCRATRFWSRQPESSAFHEPGTSVPAD